MNESFSDSSCHWEILTEEHLGEDLEEFISNFYGGRIWRGLYQFFEGIIYRILFHISAGQHPEGFVSHFLRGDLKDNFYDLEETID